MLYITLFFTGQSIISLTSRKDLLLAVIIQTDFSSNLRNLFIHSRSLCLGSRSLVQRLQPLVPGRRVTLCSAAPVKDFGQIIIHIMEYNLVAGCHVILCQTLARVESIDCIHPAGAGTVAHFRKAIASTGFRCADFTDIVILQT